MDTKLYCFANLVCVLFSFPQLQADLSQPLELGVLLENFPTCKELVIPPGTQDYRVKIRLYDTSNRLLELWVQIKAGLGGSLRVSCAP